MTDSRAAAPPNHGSDDFIGRHIGPRDHDIEEMLAFLGLSSLDELASRTIPRSILRTERLRLPAACDERAALAELADRMSHNEVFRSFIGMGYYGCFTPPVVQRNVLENPGWYTQYTPYQPEISQGRLEALLNFQTMVCDLTAMDISNASMLDEGTAAAEAMTLSLNVHNSAVDQTPAYFVSRDCHPQTIEVIQGRAWPLGIEVIVGDHASFDFSVPVFGALVQYPATDGRVVDYSSFCSLAHQHGVLVTIAADLLALTILRPPGEMGADVVIGNSQRFGVPLGFGGPHAAFMATRDAHKRRLPGRLVGVSHDADGNPAYRLALQTREQHIRREKATSNICTAQVLLAVIASMYAVYHGPEGLARIARRVLRGACTLRTGLTKLGLQCADGPIFDTVRVALPDGTAAVVARARDAKINLRTIDDTTIAIALDELTSTDDIELLWRVVSGSDQLPVRAAEQLSVQGDDLGELARTSAYLTHPVFNTFHSETEMQRYMRRLESRDLSLTTSMIPLGSCTMKLNAAAEMFPISWPEVANIHPFAPTAQTAGYRAVINELEGWLAEITGFAAASIQPNAGSQGEFAGLLVIRKYHQSRGEEHRRVCLIPQSAHGTNPASAVMAGMRVVVVACDDDGNVDVDDLERRAAEHAAELGALMVTYPSTHGVFEEEIRRICDIIHQHGGQVYMDGANMNAQVGLCRPGDFGPDVCHLNLHKTFCIPHGGGGPGVGPIAVAAHLASYLPGNRTGELHGPDRIATISAAPYGSASILPISWMYIRMMGAEGLARATAVAILSANYIARRLESHYPVLYKGRNGLVAHECILDVRQLKDTSDIGVEDVAKRLMDYGFHAPTMSFPVAGTLMVEPTESEAKEELDRFCNAMVAIRDEVREIEAGTADAKVNLLKMAPHTAATLTADSWDRPYSRQRAAFPSPATRKHKYWPPVGRVDNAYGDRHLICACPPIDSYEA